MAEMLRVYAVGPITKGEWKDNKRKTQPHEKDKLTAYNRAERAMLQVFCGKSPTTIDHVKYIDATAEKLAAFASIGKWTPTFGQHLRQRRIRLEKLRDRATSSDEYKAELKAERQRVKQAKKAGKVRVLPLVDDSDCLDKSPKLAAAKQRWLKRLKKLSGRMIGRSGFADALKEISDAAVRRNSYDAELAYDPDADPPRNRGAHPERILL